MIPYITIDTTLAKKEWFDYKKDFMLTVSQHSKSILNSYGYKNIEILNHITNEENFYKLDFKDKLKAKNNIFKTNKYDDYFIVGSLNCNSYRKKWDILIKSFCIFAKDKDKDKCLLLLKTKPFNKTKDLIYGGYNIPNLINYYANMYGINHDNFKIFDEHLDNNGLNQFYNICDVFLNTTSGEGWGLTNIEAALVKTPLIIPKNTSLIEIFGDQYEGYLEGKLYSSHIARTGHFVNNENNKIDNLFCFTAVFYDDYEYNKIEYVDQIVNFDDIPIIFIGSEVYENENIYRSFKKYADFLDFYKESNDLPKYFKVLASVDFDLINELCFLFKEDAFFTEKNKYRIIHISKKTVENSCSSETNPLVHIVSASKTADLLDRYFKDESIRNISSNYVYNRVKGKYNYENIENQFNNIMDQWNL